MEQSKNTCSIIKIWKLLSHQIQKWFSFGIVGLNSFVLLYYHSEQEDFQKVVLAGAVSYAVVLFLQTIFYRHTPERRVRILRLTKKVFRLIYTAVYLTSIMMNIIVASETLTPALPMVYYSCFFVWTMLWGTNCLWLRKVIPILSHLHASRNPKADREAYPG